MSASIINWGCRPAAAAAILALAACGGSGNNYTAPMIASIADQNVDQDTPTAALNLGISDAQTQADQLTLMLTSSNPSVVPPAGLALSGSAGNRALTVTPATGATGASVITVTVTDAGGLSSSKNFRVTVNPVVAVFSTLSTSLFAGDMNSMPQRVDNITFTFDADSNPDAFDALLN
jgi:hypothetical protein